jgi:GAF domain-containing protein
MVQLSTQLRSLLLAEAERARIAVDAGCASISRWDRLDDVLAVLINAGHVRNGCERYPQNERYPLDSFPAMAALLRERRAYMDPDDVSSMALTAQMGYATHAAVPILTGGACWGELWVCRWGGRPPFTRVDLAQLKRVAERLGDALGPYV